MPQGFAVENVTIAMAHEDLNEMLRPKLTLWDMPVNNDMDKDQTFRARPPSQGPDDPSSGGPSILIVVVVPIVSALILVLLTATAYKTWKHYKAQPRRSGNGSDFDPEAVFEEQEPLKITEVETKDQNMQIFQDADKKSSTREKARDETKSNVTHHPPLPPGKTPGVTFAGVERKDSKDETHTRVIVEEICERPSTLKFLAASAAFQASTIPALKRLPYTPDPDCTLCEVSQRAEHTEPTERECEDKVAPLAPSTPRTKRMKPRGLLERRGSNVALTISLLSGEKSNSTAAITSTKSPKPLAYLQRASSPLSPNELHAKSCDTGRLQKEFWEIPMNYPSEKDFNVAGHGTKNRYRTILPNEHSRIKLPLTPGEDPLSTYINANYIRDCTDLPPPNSSTDEEAVITPVTREDAAFIATQGPMANTVTDFWRMAWQENAASIVMITKLKERKEKCTQYLPIDVDETLVFDDINIKVVSMKKYEHFAVRSLEVTHDGQARQLRHFWYTTWMDHETPEKTRGLLELVQEVSIWNKPAHGPMVIHCSAGIGRTGCYIAVTVGCQQLMKTGKTNILRLVSQMRLDRGGMIQTWEQYQFVHQALSRYARILAGENVTTPSTTGSIRSPPDLGRLVGAKDVAGSETPRPHTPKHRRSLSETNLPSPKEMKLNLKNATSQQTTHNSSSPKIISSEKSRPSKLRNMKIRSPKTPPAMLPRHNETGSPSRVVKAVPSPTIRSPFGRLCLQTKDMNATSLPASHCKFEYPESNSGAGEGQHSLPVKADPGKAFDFNFAVPTALPVKTVSKNAKARSMNGPQKHRFELDLKAPPMVTNGELHNDVKPSSDLITSKCDPTAKSITPETNPHPSHFVFPLPDKR